MPRSRAGVAARAARGRRLAAAGLERRACSRCSSVAFRRAQRTSTQPERWRRTASRSTRSSRRGPAGTRSGTWRSRMRLRRRPGAAGVLPAVPAAAAGAGLGHRRRASRCRWRASRCGAVFLYRLTALELGAGRGRPGRAWRSRCSRARCSSRWSTARRCSWRSRSARSTPARTGRWAWAGALGALAAATRSAGVVLLVPLALLWWAHSRRRARRRLAGARPGSASWRSAARWRSPAMTRWRRSTPRSSRYRSFAGPFVGAWDGDGRRLGRRAPAAVGLARARVLHAGGRRPVRRRRAQPRACSRSSSRSVPALSASRGGCRRPTWPTCVTALALPLSWPVAPQPLMSLPRFEAVLFPRVHVARLVDRGAAAPRAGALVYGAVRRRARRRSAPWSRPGTGSLEHGPRGPARRARDARGAAGAVAGARGGARGARRARSSEARGARSAPRGDGLLPRPPRRGDRTRPSSTTCATAAPRCCARRCRRTRARRATTCAARCSARCASARIPRCPASLRRAAATRGSRVVVVSNWDVSLHERAGRDRACAAARRRRDLGRGRGRQARPGDLRAPRWRSPASRPDEALHVGDTLDADVAGAARGGPARAAPGPLRRRYASRWHRSPDSRGLVQLHRSRDRRRRQRSRRPTPRRSPRGSRCGACPHGGRGRRVLALVARPRRRARRRARRLPDRDHRGGQPRRSAARGRHQRDAAAGRRVHRRRRSSSHRWSRARAPGTSACARRAWARRSATSSRATWCSSRARRRGPRRWTCTRRTTWSTSSAPTPRRSRWSRSRSSSAWSRRSPRSSSSAATSSAPCATGAGSGRRRCSRASCSAASTSARRPSASSFRSRSSASCCA